MNKFTVGFSKPKKWKPLAKLIMLIGRTPFSHTFNTWKCIEIDRRKVFEAVGSGIRIISNKTFKKEAEIVELYHFEASDEAMVKMEQMAHDMAGGSYGYKALVGLGISKFCNWINYKIGLKGTQGNIFKDGNESNVCIEASARQLCEMIGLELPIDIETYDLAKYRELVKAYGVAASSEKIARINGK